MMHGDPTWAIPDGENMMEFSARMFDEPEKLNEESRIRVEQSLELAAKLDEKGHLLDGFALCSDYCFNVNPFFSPDSFDELIGPFLKEVIAEYQKLGYYTIKHTDGNIMPILKQIADCRPDAILPWIPREAFPSLRCVRLWGRILRLWATLTAGFCRRALMRNAARMCCARCGKEWRRAGDIFFPPQTAFTPACLWSGMK